jgi:hypothetical protein
MNTIEVGRSTLSFAADATEVLESGIRNFGQNGAADYEELSNRLFLEGYAQHASTLTRVLNENGAPGTKYFEHIFAATAISARNISAANGEYSVFLSNKSYYPSNGSDFFVMPGRVKQFTAQGGDDVVMIGRGNSSVKDESGIDIYVALGTGNTIEFDASLDTITIARVKDTVTVTAPLERMISCWALQNSGLWTAWWRLTRYPPKPIEFIRPPSIELPI